MTCPQCVVARGAESKVDKIYAPTGQFMKTESGMRYYRNGSGNLGVLVIPDLFGFNETNKNVFDWCDELADAGYNVICVDFFHGNPWDINKMPPVYPWHFAAFIKWIIFDNPSEEQVKADFYDEIMPLWKGIDRMAVIGFCWGAVKGFSLACDGKFTCAISFHGMPTNVDRVSKIKCPVLYCPTRWDVSPRTVRPVLDKKPFASLNRYRHWVDQSHGFTVQKNKGNEETGEKIKEAKNLTKEFLDDVLRQNKYNVDTYVEAFDEGLKYYHGYVARWRIYKALIVGMVAIAGGVFYADKTGRIDVRQQMKEMKARVGARFS